jgi:glycosyltransferase involved in cell wall biosynthesis
LLPIVDVIIPALNEAESLPKVLADLPCSSIRQVIVVDNGSTDETAEVARSAGAIVLLESQRGYGAACLRGIAHALGQKVQPDVLAFLDGDFSDDPRQLTDLLAPLASGEADLVLGSRVLGTRHPKSLTWQQRFGNALATFLIDVLYGHKYSDLGPFRAITRKAYLQLDMADQNYGWTVEMQIKAIRLGLRVVEIPVDYRARSGGTSKVSGTLRGTFGAGYKILKTIFIYHWVSRKLKP